MKKAILSILILFTLNSFSQINLGFYAGSGLFSVNSKDFEFQSSKIGFDFGLSYNYLISEKFEIFVDAGYSKKTPVIRTYASRLLDDVKDIDLKYGGLNYSLLANYNVYEDIVGIQAGFTGNAVFSHNSDLLNGRYVKNILNTFDTPKPTYGVIFGVSGKYDKFRLNLRYSFSFRELTVQQ